MPHYATPLMEFRFLLEEVFDYEQAVTTLPDLQDASLDVVFAALEAAGEFSREVLLPANLPGDREGCRMVGKAVRTPAGYREAYEAFRDGGWPSLAGDPAYGGQGLPLSLALFVREIVASGSMAFGMYGGLSQGAYRAISSHGSEHLRKLILPRLVDGSWTGTMCLTEPESGSDLSRLRTRAVPADEKSFCISGTKIFISGGDHDLAENIVHLVLARLPDAPAGTRGISLFAVPKLWPEQEGTLVKLAPNGVQCTAIEHKMGIRGSATAALSFEGARGWLLGQPHGGLRAMFTMMNSSRLGVAVQSVGVAELALQNARAYALDRVQGTAPGNARPDGQPDPIGAHPDVRRNLLIMKSLVEGCRALYVEQAIALDVRARHPDPEVRQQTDAQLALMTPVLKSFISDAAVEVTRLAMVIHGGHGYIHETGMEQLLRDASIVPLYEGTNGIQALDLVHRKVAADDGQAIGVFARRTRALLKHQPQQLEEMGSALASALNRLEEGTAWILERARSDAAAVAAGASDYLRMLGLVACGAAWLRMARAAVRQAPGQAPSFHAGKLAAARFYHAQLLPDVERLAGNIRHGAASVLDVAPELI